MQLKKLPTLSKLILCTYKNLSETPLNIYQTLLHEICGPKNCFKIFVIFSNDSLTTKIFIKAQLKLGTINSTRFIIRGITPIFRLLFKKNINLSKLVPVEEIKFDFDLEYNKYLITNGIPAQFSDTINSLDSIEYIEAKSIRIQLIKAKYNQKIIKYQEKLKKETAKLPKILEREQILFTDRVNEQSHNYALIHEYEELQRKLKDLESIITTEITTKRLNC